MAIVWYCITSFVKHQITRRPFETGKMLPVAKILAENANRLLDAMPDRPPRPDLAARMGIGDKTLGFIKSGTGNPTLETVAAVAAYLKVKPWELLCPAGSVPTQSQSQPARLDGDMIQQAFREARELAAQGGAEADDFNPATNRDDAGILAITLNRLLAQLAKDSGLKRVGNE